MDIRAYQQIPEKKRVLWETLGSCTLCPRKCEIDRRNGQLGYCGLDSNVFCFREMTNLAEEPELVPSHQIYFAGCNLRCGFCSVAEWNESPVNVPIIAIDQLVEKIADKRRQGAVNLNLLGGEPSVNIYGILNLLEHIPSETSIVWNSNMYFLAPVRQALEGLVDIFLSDYKCGNNDCAQSLLGISDYQEVVEENLIWAAQQAQLIIRHVIMPGHIECCSRPVMQWIALTIPNQKVSLRFDYIPPIPAGDCPGGYLTEQDIMQVTDIARQLKLNII